MVRMEHHYPLAIEAGLDDGLMDLVKKGRGWGLSGMEEMANGTLRWIVFR
jgi:hypothetical protein